MRHQVIWHADILCRIGLVVFHTGRFVLMMMRTRQYTDVR
jgi:hypothetical protein